MFRLQDMPSLMQPGSSGGVNWQLLDAMPPSSSPADPVVHRTRMEECTVLQAHGKPVMIKPGIPRNMHLTPATELSKPIK
jgi:hypothetical protein